MPVAYLDTTILVDVLLKQGTALQRTAKSAIARFAQTRMPMYAIKEFKAGALRNYIWFHNKLVNFGYSRAMAALQRESMTPRRYLTATALQALAQAAQRFGRSTTQDLVDEFGANARLENVQRDRFRLQLAALILNAWRKRNSVVTAVTEPLSCYIEAPPKCGEDGLIDAKPYRCTGGACCLTPLLKAEPEMLQLLRRAIRSQPAKRENVSRASVLHDLSRKPRHFELSDQMCRQLGDIIFVFFAPKDAVILTTNIRDFEPLAAAVGKTVQTP